MSATARRARPRAEVGFLDGEGLERIEPEWADLWHRCTASPFQHPAWLLPWARRYAPGRTGAAALRVGGRLAGLAPVFTWEGALLLAGTGPSDHADWLLAPDAGYAADALLAEVTGAPGAFDRIDLRQLPPGSALIDTPAPPGWQDAHEDDEPCHLAPLDGEDGLGAASKKCRANWRYAIRRIGREGGAVEPVPPGDTQRAMQNLSRLHALRWQAKGESGVLADPLLDGFLRDAAPALDHAGLLRLRRLRFGAETIAVLLVLAGRRTHHYYLGGFDPEYARLSPSAALVGAAMAQAAREGAEAFDFLRGAEPYKARWGARPGLTGRRILTR